jgi:hypothetical protein
MTKTITMTKKKKSLDGEAWRLRLPCTIPPQSRVFSFRLIFHMSNTTATAMGTRTAYQQKVEQHESE